MYDLCQSSPSICRYLREGIEENNKLKVNMEIVIEAIAYLLQNSLTVFSFGSTETHIQ